MGCVAYILGEAYDRQDNEGDVTFNMLQSLLQPRDNQRPKMIGAMPAVAVRHERRRVEKRSVAMGRRPSQLPLNIGRPPDAEATPSPDHHRIRNELYVCGKVAALHAVVGSLLLGIVVLVVGLVQLSPGAEAAQHRYYFIGIGAALTGAGVVGALLRCICLHWFNRKFREEEEVQIPTTHKNGVSVVESTHEKPGHDHKSHDHKGHDHKSHDQKGHDHKGHDHKGHDHKGHDHKSHEKPAHDHKCEKDQKPKLKAQASVGRDMDLIKQPSAASDT